jgi:hypothetical protein
MARLNRDAIAYRTELARAFNARRCACGAPAHCVTVGTASNKTVGVIVLRRGAPDRNLCLKCAGLREVVA